jgi:hypothetical protein
MARIYISSTFSDLQDYRSVVYRTLRQMQHDVIAMEDYVATDARPVDRCLADVVSCDLYVGIFAFRYGYVPAIDNAEGRSITELEYRKAGDAGVPRLVFLVKDGAAWPTSLIDALSSIDDAKRIAALRETLKRDHIDSFFESAEELARKVSVAVPIELQRSPVKRMRVDLDAARRRLVEHMRAFAGARSDDDALNRYSPLTLQATQPIPGDPQPYNLAAGAWSDLVRYPAQVVLTGEAGSGKTTLLLHEAWRLSHVTPDAPAPPLPIYLSLHSFRGGNANTLLEMAAAANELDPRAVQALWAEPTRPVCLMLDGGDETPHRDELIDAILDLARRRSGPPAEGGPPAPPETRSLVVACHPGPLQDRLRSVPRGWNELLLLPLRRAEVDDILTRFDAASLIPLLDGRLRRVLRRPDLLAALAQSARGASADTLPRSAATIYGLYLAHVFATAPGGYDYERVQRPLLARLAYEMLCERRTDVACDDTLYEWMASDLEALSRRYHRRRKVMPPDWSAEDLHDQLLASPVVDRAAGRGERITFSKPLYRDYFAAVHVVSTGVTGSAARELAKALAGAEDLRPLSFALGMDPAAGALLDVLPAASATLAAQVWLEHGPKGQPAPESIQLAYGARRAAIWSEVLDPSLAGPIDGVATRPPDARQRFAIVDDLARQRPLPLRDLIEWVDDDHPLVRARAQYALLFAGDPRGAFDLASRNGRFAWQSYGAGAVTIGPLTLLRVPVAMAVDLAVDIRELDVDPFDASCEVAFIAPTPALFAGELFGSQGGVDWLDLLARLQAIASASAHLARPSPAPRGQEPFVAQLTRRAAEYAAVGQLLAADLGLPWEAVDPAESTETTAAAEQTYRDLKSLFSQENQARTLRLSNLAEDNVVQASLSHKRAESGAQVVHLKIGRVESTVADEIDAPPFVFVRSSQDVRAVEGATVRGVEIGVVNIIARELPLLVHINNAMAVRHATDAVLEGIRVRTLEGSVCPWRVHMSFDVRQFIRSQLHGVVFDPG